MHATMTSSSSSSPTLWLLLLLLVLQSLNQPIQTQPDHQLAVEQAFDDFKLGLWFCANIDDESIATWILSEEDGLRTLSAILKRFSIKSFIWADDNYLQSLQPNINETMMYVPSCPASMKMYVRRIENEKELLELDTDLIDDLRCGRREVTRVRKKMVGVDGSQIFNVSGHVLNEDLNFGVDEVGGFGSLESEFPDKKEGMYKIEFAVVAEIGGFGADETELEKLRSFLGHDHANNLQTKIGERATFQDVPVTMLYSLYF